MGRLYDRHGSALGLETSGPEFPFLAIKHRLCHP